MLKFILSLLHQEVLILFKLINIRFGILTLDVLMNLSMYPVDV